MALNMISRSFVALTLAAVAIPANAQTATASKVISDQILPRDTVLYVSMPSVAAAEEHFNSSSMGQLWNDAEFDAFKDEVSNAFGSDLEQGLAQFEAVMGMPLMDFLDIPEGEVSLAIATAPGNAMGAVLFLDFGDKESQIRGLLDRAVGALGNVPKLSQEDKTFDDTELTMFTINHDGPPPTPLAKEFGWFVKDQRLVLSNRSELLESVLTNWSGESSSSFLSNESYSFIRNRCEVEDRSALSVAFVDPIGLVTKLIQTGSLGPQLTLGASMAMGFIQPLGLNQMKAIGGASKPGSGDMESVTRMVFYAEQPPRGLMQAMQMDAVNTTPPDWVKDNVTMYMGTKWKIDEAFQAINGIAGMFGDPQALSRQLDAFAEQGPGIHLKKDIIDQLTGELRLVTAPAESGTVGGDQMVLALGVKDEDGAEKVVSRIADEIGMETREFRGGTIYEMVIPNSGASMGLTISDGRLLFGTGSTLLDQVLRNDSDMKPLSESEEFQKVAQHVPRTAVSMTFQRPAEQYRSIYEALRAGTAAEQFPGAQDFLEKIDFTTLPPFDVVSKYVHSAGAYTVADDNGYFTEGFQLKD